MSAMILRHLTIKYFTRCVRLSYTWCNGDPYINPTSELQGLVVVPLFSANEAAFNPSLDELKGADSMFKAVLESGNVAYLKGVIDASTLPKTSLPEVCFIGRSNVGKSSLIKALFFNSKAVDISVSKTPGHTKALKLYQVGKKLTMVDMPGYGYNMPTHYVDSVENYIKTRQMLVRTFLLLDATVGVTDTDKIGIEMMEEFGRPYSVVLTKIDKLTPPKVLRTLLDLKQKHEKRMKSTCLQPFLISSQQNVGLSFLRAFIVHVTGNGGSWTR